MSEPRNIDHIVQGILSDMSLREKAVIANIDEDKVPFWSSICLHIVYREGAHRRYKRT